VKCLVLQVLIAAQFESQTPPKTMLFDLSKLVKQSLLGRQTNFLQSFNSSIPAGKLLI
jgi:hypothetical protein